MDVKEKVLDAIQLMASNSVKNAGYDKTIQAQIVSCQDATIGKYRCRYQDSVFYAYSNNTDMSFNKGADVYILVPGNDFKQEKTILGTTQKLGVNYISQIQKEQSYQQIGINCIDANDIFYLNSNNTNYKYAIYDHSQDDGTFLDITSLNEYIKSSSSLVISADFKTSIPANRQYKGHYGIRFNLAFQDNSSGENVIRSYEINEDNMVGNPYRLAYSTKQDQIFDIDGENFVRVDSIEIFNNGFPNANGNTSSGRLNTGDIEITNLQLFGAVMLTESQLNGVNITFYTPQGSFFTDSSTSTTTKTIVAQVRVKGKLVSAAQNIPFYWGRENARITASDLLYNKHLGRGWQCLNQSNVIQATDGSDPIIEWVPGKDTLYVTFEDSPAENNRYKVAIVYDETVVTKEINIKNLASIVTRISISSDGGTKFYYDNGHPNLTCKVIAVDGNEETDITSNCNFYWAYQSNTGIMTELPVTTIDNTRYNNAQQQLNTRLAAIAAGTAYANASESYIAERQNIIDSYRYIQRVENNVIHDVQIRNITNFGTFKCSVYNATNNLYYGTAAITLTNTYEGQNLYSLVINNGSVTFQYNEEGIAPNNKSLDTPQTIQALSFTVYDNLGNPIDSNDIINSRNCSVRWYFPIENTLLVDTLQNGQDAGIDDYQQYKYYDNNIILTYNIATKYDIKKKFNQIKLNVNYKGMNLTTETQFNFVKQGEPGTNGTEYIVKLVPNTRANNVPLYPMITKVYNNNSTVILNYKINSLEDGQSNINIGSGNSYQLFKAQLWHNGDMVWEGCSIPTEIINGEEVPISIDNDQNVKDQITRPSMIHWEVLKNQYTNSLSDNSDFQVSNALTGYIYYKGDHLQDNTNYLKPYANIIKCSVTWEGKTYYGTIPIITAYVSNSNYRVGLKDYTGFRYVMYTSDGILPKYDTTHPFEFTIKRYIDNIWEDISLVAGSNEITYTPFSCGPVSADAIDYEDKVLLQLLDQQYYRYEDERGQDGTRKLLNKNQWKYKPKSRYDGECVTTAVLCEYKNNNNVIGRINIPIHFLLNKYGLAEINEWDGNSVQINQQGGYILAPQMGAGYKDSNNNFTGVLMGQVKETAKGKTLPEMGLFGYSQGDRTFFLNSQNGAAIFGKTNGGQIIIDPSDEVDQVVDGTTTVAVPRNKALLYSDSFWKNYNDDGLPINYHTSNQKGEGMLIDLSTPAIRWGNDNFSVTEEGYLTARGGGYIAGWLIGDKTLSADNSTITLHSGGDLLNPNQPYDATTNPYLGGRIYSENHDNLTSTNNGFYIDKDGLSIGSKFKITSDGIVSVGKDAVKYDHNADDATLKYSLRSQLIGDGTSSGRYVNTGEEIFSQKRDITILVEFEDGGTGNSFNQLFNAYKKEAFKGLLAFSESDGLTLYSPPYSTLERQIRFLYTRSSSTNTTFRLAYTYHPTSSSSQFTFNFSINGNRVPSGMVKNVIDGTTTTQSTPIVLQGGAFEKNIEQLCIGYRQLTDSSSSLSYWKGTIKKFYVYYDLKDTTFINNFLDGGDIPNNQYLSRKHWVINTNSNNGESYIAYNTSTFQPAENDSNTRMYFGTDGLSLGKSFFVSNYGDLRITKGSIKLGQNTQTSPSTWNFSVNNRGYLEAQRGTIAGIEMWEHGTVSELRAGTKDSNNNNKLTKGFVLQSTGRVLGIGTQYYDTDQGNVLYNLDLMLYYLMPESTAAQQQAKAEKWNEIQTNISNHYYQQPSYNIWAFNEDSGIFQGGTSDWYNGNYRIQNQHFRIQPANGYARFEYVDVAHQLAVGGPIVGFKDRSYSNIHLAGQSDITFNIDCQLGRIDAKGEINSGSAMNTPSIYVANNVNCTTVAASGNISASGWIGATSYITSNDYISAANGWSGNLTVNSGNFSTTGTIGATGDISTSGYISATRGWYGNLTVDNGNFSTTGTIGATGSISTSNTIRGLQAIFDDGNGTVKCGQIIAPTVTINGVSTGFLAIRDNAGNKAVVDGIVYAVFG